MIISILFIGIVLILAFFTVKKLRADAKGGQATRQRQTPTSHHHALGSSPLNKNTDVQPEAQQAAPQQKATQMKKSGVLGLDQKAKELEQVELGDPLFTDEIEKPVDRAIREEKEEVLIQAEKNKQNSQPLDYVAIQLLAPEDYPYTGYELLQSLLANGMRFGDRQIFHRHESRSGHGDVMFSLASIAKPGTFDLPKMGGFSCPGLAMFMVVDQVADPMASFDLMLETANSLLEDLGGELCDERHESLTSDKIAGIRESLLSMPTEA